jgi:hypothetical protein
MNGGQVSGTWREDKGEPWGLAASTDPYGGMLSHAIAFPIGNIHYSEKRFNETGQGDG